KVGLWREAQAAGNSKLSSGEDRSRIDRLREGRVQYPVGLLIGNDHCSMDRHSVDDGCVIRNEVGGIAQMIVQHGMVLVPHSEIEGQARVHLPVILHENPVMTGVGVSVRLN